MSGSLITLPWRLGAFGAGLVLRTAGGIVHLAGDVAGLAGAGRTPSPAGAESFERAPSRVAHPPAAPKATAPVAPPRPSRPSARIEPSHVSEERELVEEVAEPGAQDGAGAQVTIAEPWDDYRLMNAGAVIDRLPDLTPAELAGVELYEPANRHRKTLLTAVRRELKRRS